MDTALIIFIISSGLVVVGVMLWKKGNYLITHGRKAEAIIFRNNVKPGGAMYYPVVRVLTDKQQWITQELSIGYSPARSTGTKLQVIYDPDEPTNVEIYSTLQLEVLPRLLVALGVAGVIFGALEYADIITLISD